MGAGAHCKELVRELRNTPSHQLHQVLEDRYKIHVGIKTTALMDVERYPSVSFVDDPITMQRTITVIEDLAWVVPVEGAQMRGRASERELSREEEEVGLILRGLGLENDQEGKPGNGTTRIGDEPPAYEAEGPDSLLRYRGYVNP